VRESAWFVKEQLSDWAEMPVVLPCVHGWESTETNRGTAASSTGTTGGSGELPERAQFAARCQWVDRQKVVAAARYRGGLKGGSPRDKRAALA